jgi:hypothetical protein
MAVMPLCYVAVEIEHHCFRIASAQNCSVLGDRLSDFLIESTPISITSHRTLIAHKFSKREFSEHRLSWIIRAGRFHYYHEGGVFVFDCLMTMHG